MKISNLTIGGTFQGEVNASDELVILSTGNCSGKVVCRNLVVEGGGKLNAQVFSSMEGDMKLVSPPIEKKLEEKKGEKKNNIVEI